MKMERLGDCKCKTIFILEDKKTVHCSLFHLTCSSGTGNNSKRHETYLVKICISKRLARLLIPSTRDGQERHFVRTQHPVFND